MHWGEVRATTTEERQAAPAPSSSTQVGVLVVGRWEYSNAASSFADVLDKLNWWESTEVLGNLQNTSLTGLQFIAGAACLPVEAV
jgi:hypothetical protein